ncbi:hypothetical protein GCM10009860_00710 [Microbacterium mitrae]|uniref:Uncharacterized protein n=1 Tax=Microbacterium mitrae TaxID=664640 RepID=A0A5C8HN47_9MICO|nr:hypothetical protein [Microbacterium mitrae]TXK05496.1 hypothetical protein FVP60_00390 [Microbacterium mitrae]
MQGPDEFYPPYQYGWGWLLLAVGLIALVLVAWALVLWFTRIEKPPKQSTQPSVPVTADVLTQLRYEYAARIDQIEAAYTAGAMSPKTANRELSALVRSYVNEYSGLEAPVLSLSDLVELGVHPALIDALQRHYYPSIFRKDMVIDPVAGAAAARAVVSSWY